MNTPPKPGKQKEEELKTLIKDLEKRQEELEEQLLNWKVDIVMKDGKLRQEATSKRTLNDEVPDWIRGLWCGLGFHFFGKWSNPSRRSQKIIMTQIRTCSRCNLIRERGAYELSRSSTSWFDEE